MNIKILWPWELPKILDGVAVVTDVWGATTNLNSFFRKGVKKLVIVNKDTVQKAKKEYNDVVIIGESLELPKNFFDASNYPADIELLDIKDKTVLYMSNNGSRIIELVSTKKARKIITFSFTNISSVADYLKDETKNIYLIPSGDFTSINQKVMEDLICVEALEKILTGQEVDLEETQMKAKNYIIHSYSKQNFDHYANFKIVFNLNSSKVIPDCKQEKGLIVVENLQSHTRSVT